MKLLQILFVLAIILIIWYFIQSRDYYGQDPSIRASVGWIAGPLYGQDPITQFADEIAEMERKIHLRCHKICKGRSRSGECHECVRQAQN